MGLCYCGEKRGGNRSRFKVGGGLEMKYMMHWSSDPETRHDAYKTFGQMSDADDQADHPGVTLIGRWHDVVAGVGVLI